MHKIEAVAENVTDRKIPDPTTEEISSLIVEIIEYDLPEEEKVYPQCEEHLHVMSKETK